MIRCDVCASPATRGKWVLTSPTFSAIFTPGEGWAGYTRDQRADTWARLTPREVLRRLGLTRTPACPLGRVHPRRPGVHRRRA